MRAIFCRRPAGKTYLIFEVRTLHKLLQEHRQIARVGLGVAQASEWHAYGARVFADLASNVGRVTDDEGADGDDASFAGAC